MAWRSEARPQDAAGDQLWLRALRWQPSTQPPLDLREPEALIPRICEGSIGDQRTPALARVGLPPDGALAIAWDDYAKRQGQGEPDVVVHYAPTHERDPAWGDIFDEPFVGANGSAWSSHWSSETLSGVLAVTLEGERGKVGSVSGTSAGLLLVNHHEALNVDITTDVQFRANGSSAGIVARRADSDPDSYFGARFGTNAELHLRLYAIVDNVETDLKTLALPPRFAAHAQGLYFKLRFRVENVSGGVRLATKYWSAELPEPATWMLEETVTTGSAIATRLGARAGKFGLYARNGGVDVCLPEHCSNNRLETALGEITKDCGGECGSPCP